MMAMERGGWHASLALLLFLLEGAAAGAEPSYEADFTASRELEQEGRFAAALDALDDLEADYPQDFALMLRLGWLAYRAERYGRTARYYDRATELSGGAVDARLGRAWTDLRCGLRADARAGFTALAAMAGNDARVQEGLEAAASFRQVLELAPRHTTARQGLDTIEAQ